MSCIEKIIIFEQAKWQPPLVFTNRARVPQSIAGYTFLARFLDREGGAILKTIPVINLEDEGGNIGEFQPILTQAEATKFRDDKKTPGWFELYVYEEPGADRLKWMNVPVKYKNGGR